MKLELGDRYWPFYCEENVWHLATDCLDAGVEANAIFISNRARAVAFWHQKCAREPDGLHFWDYHVVLFVHAEHGWRVHDVDSRLPNDLSARRYIEASFPELPAHYHRFEPAFRIVDARTYVDELCTDRRHMRDADGRWSRPPPDRAPIGQGSNLMRFVDLDDPFLGEVVSREALLARFSG